MLGAVSAMTTFLALHKKLDTILARARSALIDGATWVEVQGGLPNAPRRHAYVGGTFIEPEPGELRTMFELRLAQMRAPVVVFGGLPPLPGTDTMFKLPWDEVAEADRHVSYWDSGDPVGDIEPGQ